MSLISEDDEMVASTVRTIFDETLQQVCGYRHQDKKHETAPLYQMPKMLFTLTR